ncbi:MAG: MBL fold metallo-hydrolase [Elusimicrobia bacterium]|nr:MBL fold metallo-hydrolase [Elusimicrobiota bacterium]
MIRLCEGVYRLESGGFVNSYLLEGERDLTLVDAGPARRAEALLAELKGNAFSLADVGRVVVTHAHGDHAGGLARLLALRPIKVYAHPAETAVLTGEAPVPSFRGALGFLLETLSEQVLSWSPVDNVMPAQPGTPVRGLPRWQILHTPGHTAGSLSLYEPVKQVLLCGDLLSNRGGRLHRVRDALDQDPAQSGASVSRVAAMDVDILGCGHGPEVRGGAFRHIEGLVRGEPASR